MAREGLLVELRRAIARVRRTRAPVRREGLRIRQPEAFAQVNLEVNPVTGPGGERDYLVLFERVVAAPPTRAKRKPAGAATAPKARTTPRGRIESLRRELTATKELLQSIIEERKAASEELAPRLSAGRQHRKVELGQLETRMDRLAAARDYSESIVDTIREPLLVLDAALRVRSASRAFYEMFQVRPEETVGKLVHDLGTHPWDIPALRALLSDVAEQNSAFQDFEVERDFGGLGARIMLLNARRIDGKSQKNG